jgi:hypothetical protein
VIKESESEIVTGQGGSIARLCVFGISAGPCDDR